MSCEESVLLLARASRWERGSPLEYTDGEGSAGGIQRWCPRDHHHHHGSGAPTTPRYRTLGSAAAPAGFPELHTELRLSGDLLEQPSPHASRHPPSDGRGSLGESAPAVLALTGAVRHGLDGGESPGLNSFRALWGGSADGGRRLHGPAATNLACRRAAVSPGHSCGAGPQGKALYPGLCARDRSLVRTPLAGSCPVRSGGTHLVYSGSPHRAGRSQRAGEPSGCFGRVEQAEHGLGRHV